jgi:carbamoyl-phosphate synthase large subunit
MAGTSLKEQKIALHLHADFFTVKEPVFPFTKFPGSDPILGPEMKSTGEAMGVGNTFGEAYYKAQLGSGSQAPRGGKAILSVKESDKLKIAETARALIDVGFEIYATQGTAKQLIKSGVFCQRVNKVHEGRPHLVDMIKNDEIDYIVNTTEGLQAVSDSYLIRRSALQYNVAYTTTLAAGLATASAIAHQTRQKVITVQELHQRLIEREYQ